MDFPQDLWRSWFPSVRWGGPKWNHQPLGNMMTRATYRDQEEGANYLDYLKLILCAANWQQTFKSGTRRTLTEIIDGWWCYDRSKTSWFKVSSCSQVRLNAEKKQQPKKQPPTTAVFWTARWKSWLQIPSLKRKTPTPFGSDTQYWRDGLNESGSCTFRCVKRLLDMTWYD